MEDRNYRYGQKGFTGASGEDKNNYDDQEGFAETPGESKDDPADQKEYTATSDRVTGSGTNRWHKDRLFKALFGSPERKELTLELYNAVNGSSYTNPADIELKTIDDVVYMGMKNDVSFLFDQVMNLWEQQSTPNPNMPLRFLLYYAHVMESYVSGLGPRDGGIYSSARVQLPTPRMVLFYNGPGRMPAYLYLSDSYGSGDDPDVQVRVRVINISSGQDRILELCRPLQDYTTFVETFRGYREADKSHDRMAASRAIAELRPGVVRNYLKAHEAEVLDMLLTEYDEEKTLKAEYYAGERAGLERGLEQGVQAATTEHVVSLFKNQIPPEQIAQLLNLDQNRVLDILTRQGLV